MRDLACAVCFALASPLPDLAGRVRGSVQESAPCPAQEPVAFRVVVFGSCRLARERAGEAKIVEEGRAILLPAAESEMERRSRFV